MVVSYHLDKKIVTKYQIEFTSMGQFRNLTSEEAAKLDPKEIGKGIPAGEGEVEAQDRMVHCHQCKAHYYTKVNYRYTICPNCGHIMEWTY